MAYEPLVSVITPCYNHEKFIARCIESVISQTYENWEMIVVDDCSYDGSLEIAEGYAKRDARIKLIRHEVNYGADRLTSTYNEALSASSGELIAILEGDDLWAPHKLGAQVPSFQDENVVLVYSDFDEISDSGDLIKHHHVRVDHGSLTTGPPRNLEFFSRLSSLGANTIVIRKATLARIGGFASAEIPTVDFPTWLILSLEGRFVCVPETLAFWRRHRGSVYFNNAAAMAEGTTEFLYDFLENNRGRIERHGLAIETLCENAESALRWRRATDRYFEGKYHLIFGDHAKARMHFFGALTSLKTPLRHRAAAVIGILASWTSKRVLLSASNVRASSFRRHRS